MSEITLEEWEVTYKPIANHLNPNASFTCGDGEGTLFETYGEEYDFVTSQPDNLIWTYLDGDDGSLIVQGWHFVNRIGYFISTVPFDENDDVWAVVSLNADTFICDTCDQEYYDEEAQAQWAKHETEERCDNCEGK